MTEEWKELKETIIEMRDNVGTVTQKEVCVRFLLILNRKRFIEER